MSAQPTDYSHVPELVEGQNAVLPCKVLPYAVSSLGCSDPSERRAVDLSLTLNLSAVFHRVLKLSQGPQLPSGACQRS